MSSSYHFSHIADYYHQRRMSMWGDDGEPTGACEFLTVDYDSLSSIDQHLQEISLLAPTLHHPTEGDPDHPTAAENGAQRPPHLGVSLRIVASAVPPA